MERNYLPLFEENAEFYETTYEGYRKSTETKLSSKESARKICEFMKNNHITIEDKMIFNKILGDHQILSKLIWVWDGSYRNNRLFYKRFNFHNMNQNSFSIMDSYSYKNNKNYYDMSIKERLDFLKNKYEFIFIDLVEDSTACDDMLFDEMMDCDYPDDDYDTIEEMCN